MEEISVIINIVTLFVVFDFHRFIKYSMICQDFRVLENTLTSSSRLATHIESNKDSQ